MSPSEDELRAALHAGEGGGIDADAVIAHARAARHGRRLRFGSVIAAVVVVAGVAAGVTALQAGGGSGSHPAAQPDRSSAGTVTATAPSAARSNGPATTPSAAAIQCPARPAHLMLPGGGGSGQFGGDQPIFTGELTSLVVCRYAPGTSTGATSALRLSGTQAQAVADSLNAAPTERARAPQCAGASRGTLLLRAPGQRDAVVTLGCEFESNQVTNGTSVRYDWQPPAGLARIWPSPLPTR